MYYDGANLNAICGIVAPGRHGLRRRAHQPAQDVLAAARRRRPRRRPDRGARRPRAVPAGARRRARERRRSGSSTTGRRSIGQGARASTATSASSCASTRIMRSYGPGLREMSEVAVLNANYLLARLEDAYDLPYERLCMHEFVLSARALKKEHGDQRARRREAADRLRLPPADGLLPARRPGGADDRADGDRGEGDARRVRRRDAARSRARPRASPSCCATRRTTAPVRRLDEVRAAKQPVLRYAFPS